MRTVTGSVKSPPTQWHPVLLNIAPPEICRQIATQSMTSNIRRNDNMPIYYDIEHHPNKWLKSRCSKWKADTYDNDLQVEWKRIWLESEVKNSSLVKTPTVRVPGFNLPYALWTTFSRIKPNMENTIIYYTSGGW